MKSEGESIVNGYPADALAIGNRGLHYGDGLFETLAAVEGRPLLWDRHWQRLAEGCEQLGLAAPPADAVRAAIAQLSGKERFCAVKIMVTRAAHGRGYRPSGRAIDWIVSAYPWEPPAEERRTGVLAVWCRLRLAAPNACAGMKTLNRLEQVLAQREWDPPVREGLMQDPQGFVIEGTMSNIFVTETGRLATPPLTDCGIAGVMRAAVIDAALEHAIPVCIEPLTRARIEQADELFLTNSLIGIWPVRNLAGHAFAVGPLSRRLLAILRERGDAAFS
ncbi:MAG: aminodeoxychorismate lyase [Gammaproteobacteria bacterium]|nr:aminodeoxychorismate lyase [Gammaproteobacteria bacterium]